MDSLDEKYLRPEFIKEVTATRKKILRRAKPKTFQNQNLSGEMILSLIESYIESLNNGRSITVENAWTYVCRTGVGNYITGIDASCYI